MKRYLVAVRMGSFIAQMEGTDYLETVKRMSSILKRAKEFFPEEKQSQMETFRIKGKYVETISFWTFPQNKDIETAFGEYVPRFDPSIREELSKNE